MDQHTGGKWLIHGAKHHKENQLQNLELTSRISSLRIYIWRKVVRWENRVLQGWLTVTEYDSLSISEGTLKDMGKSTSIWPQENRIEHELCA